MNTLLIIFIRNPEPGKVKTRLTDTIGEEESLKVYRKLLEHTQQVALNVPVDREVWYSDYIDREDEWSPSEFSKKLQKTGDLGDKMLYAFQEGFDSGYDKIVIIGSDCLELNVNHIKDAYQFLDQYDVVLGPSADGGYYLLGMKRLIPGLFLDKPWSEPDLYRQTVLTIRNESLTYYELEQLNDIDTWEDLKESGLK